MGEPSKPAVKRLIALSGNRCAFAGCDQEIVSHDGTFVGEICHINANRLDGARFEPTQTEKMRQAYDNLILLCRKCHKIVDANSEAFPAEVLRKMKSAHESNMARNERSADGIVAESLLNNLRGATITNNNGNVAVNSFGPVTQAINIRTNKRIPTIAPPNGTIGADINARRYVEYMIKRYEELARRDNTRRTKFRFGVLQKNVEREFGARWQLLPIERATELFSHLQAKIDGTLVGRVSKSAGKPMYSTFEAYLLKHDGPDEA